MFSPVTWTPALFQRELQGMSRNVLQHRALLPFNLLTGVIEYETYFQK